MRAVIVDDHPVVREGLCSLLSRAGVEVVGQAQGGSRALRLIRDLQPDVAVVDVALPGLSGIELCRRIRRRLPQVKVVLISMFDEPAWRAEAGRAGAAAYLLKGDPPERIVDAVLRAARGEVLLPRTGGVPPLTPREQEVVRLIAEGKKLSEIARILCRSPATVRAHKASAMRKLSVHSTTGLVRAALELGLVRVPEVPRA
ncbi:MAG: Two component transcriptional regulator, LuxR family [Acetothermia bacterium 64_32]|nr:MAG: Two component transcriptional regulator, LuxR family [Acetothermia bacterium 64_32]